MSSKDYWARRYKAMEEAVLDKAYANAENLEKQFNTAIHDIDTQMRVWYQRFAKNNDISIADARRMLTTGELKEFKWTVEEYIKKGRESNLSDEWLKELENASARVHISRLDSLKMQLRPKAEELASVKRKAPEDAASLAYTESYYHTAFEFQKQLGYGWTMQALDETALKKVLSKPWTADGKTFTARCWEDKAKLVETVNRELTRMIATGAAPDKAIERIAKIFNTSKTTAGKLVMTESAFFASTAQRDSFSELGVEKYKIVGTLDGYTCDVCGDMDSQVFDMKDFAPGSTAPPFHPWCRCATCPYFADMEGLGERFARDVETGERYKVPGDMTYKQWKAKQDANNILTNKEYRDIISGGISGARNPYGQLADEHAERYYSFIRSTHSDCPKIAKNTGFSIDDVTSIKNYLFVEEHDLSDGHRQFDADYMIAQSWQRLIEGKQIKPHDITLLKHEKLELNLVRKGVPQDEAHLTASKKHNYRKEAEEYYASLKKHRKE